jgi:dihydroorotate dehydrogenase (NAD+) catalytic subunit
MDMGVTMCGITLETPFVLASGILGNEHSLIKRVLDAGAAGAVTKTVFAQERKGYPPPVYYYTESYSLNAVGLPTSGVDHLINELEQLRDQPKPIIVSVGGFSADEYAYVTKLVSRSCASGVELNLSCPHVEGTGEEFSSSEDLVYAVVSGAVKVASGKPVFVKLPPSPEKIVGLGRASLEAGASGFTATNTVKGMAFDTELAVPVLYNTFGGVSGKALHPLAVYCVYALRKNFPEAPIFGVGGVLDHRDALEFFLAGADAVQIGTAVGTKGVSVFADIARGLKLYMKRKGFRSMKEMISAFRVQR